MAEEDSSVRGPVHPADWVSPPTTTTGTTMGDRCPACQAGDHDETRGPVEVIPGVACGCRCHGACGWRREHHELEAHRLGIAEYVVGTYLYCRHCDLHFAATQARRDVSRWMRREGLALFHLAALLKTTGEQAGAFLEGEWRPNEAQRRRLAAVMGLPSGTVRERLTRAP